jgi:hypothetical protein
MNVGELLRERDRLLGIIDEAKTARTKLKQINVLIAMYGNAEHVELISNGKAPRVAEVACTKCDGGPFVGSRGLATHMRTMHGVKGPRSRAKAK